MKFEKPPCTGSKIVGLIMMGLGAYFMIYGAIAYVIVHLGELYSGTLFMGLGMLLFCIGGMIKDNRREID